MTWPYDVHDDHLDDSIECDDTIPMWLIHCKKFSNDGHEINALVCGWHEQMGMNVVVPWCLHHKNTSEYGVLLIFNVNGL